MDTQAVMTAFRLADRSIVPELIARLRPLVLTLLRDEARLPEPLLEAVLASGDRGLCTEFAKNSLEDACDPAFRIRLAGLGHPESGRALWSAGEWVPELRAAVLAAADPADPGWYAPRGFVARLVRSKERGLLTLARQGPFPELVAHAIRLLARDMPMPVVLDACGALLDCGGGAKALAELADAIGEDSHPGLPALLREAAAASDPAGFLRDRRAPGEWEDPRAATLLLHVRTGARREVLPDAPLDWTLVRREHERRPFTTSELISLSRLPGCPEDLLMEGYRRDPYETAWHAARLPMAALVGPEARRREMYDLGRVVERSIHDGWLPIERLLTEAAPARTFLAALPYDHEPTRRAVAELLAPLGSDPTAWLTLYSRLASRFRGTPAALVAKVGASSERTTRWPAPLDATAPIEPPDALRAVFLQLYRCAPEEAQLALVPHLDLRTLQHLLVSGRPSQRLYDEVVAVHGAAALEAHAAGSCRGEDRDALLDRDEPGVNTLLYEHHSLSREQRARILAGRGRDGGDIVVDKRLIHLLRRIHLGEHRDWLTAGIGSPVPEVADVVVNRLTLHTEGGRLRVVIGLWEGQGPDAVRQLLVPDAGEHNHHWPVGTQRAVAKALDAPDGLGMLRERLAAAEDPERVITHLRKKTRKYDERIRHFLSEGGRLPWEELARAHAEDPLPAGLLVPLLAQPDCHRDLVLDALRTTPVDESDRFNPWFRTALDHGSLTIDDLVRHARPAERVLDYLLHQTWAHGRPTVRLRPSEEVVELIDRHLGVNVEAWAIALQLLSGFHGTLAELITTAGAVAR
ncbi:hypothetical protein [Streptomyces sp. NPDC053427]|uniref:hypothetical protein n=1 Tax=Streptomyces sp. NPDC053427 TaxID=3365701 RepID=UPI0037D43596